MATSDNSKRIALVANMDKPQTQQRAVELLEWLRGQGEVVADNVHNDLDLATMPQANFVIVLGGDGTLLSTVRALGERQMPLIGVNMGKLGFLAEFSMNQLREQFGQLVNDERLISRRVMLQCRVAGAGRDEYATTAVNEVAVIAGPPFRMIEVSVSVGGDHVALCAGDGLIVATPTGSTAYNLSAGGPILAASRQAAVITPLAAHSLSFRPIVMDLSKPIVVRARNVRSRSGIGPNQEDETQSNHAVAVIDGQTNTPLSGEDELIITRAEQCFQLVQNPAKSQWKLLNTKLNWGALPNYDHPGASGEATG